MEAAAREYQVLISDYRAVGFHDLRQRRQVVHERTAKHEQVVRDERRTPAIGPCCSFELIFSSARSAAFGLMAKRIVHGYIYAVVGSDKTLLRNGSNRGSVRRMLCLG